MCAYICIYICIFYDNVKYINNVNGKYILLL